MKISKWLGCLIVGLILCGGSGSNALANDRAWKWLLAGHAVGVAADATTTAQALRVPGLAEANPIYSWAGDDGVVPLRVGVGVVVGVGLHHIHKSHPRLAKTLAIVSIGTSLGAAYHNRGVVRKYGD